MAIRLILAHHHVSELCKVSGKFMRRLTVPVHRSHHKTFGDVCSQHAYRTYRETSISKHWTFSTRRFSSAMLCRLGPDYTPDAADPRR
jgi:hypothetical protein